LPINFELFGLYVKEEQLWYQISHEKWLLEGDLNTSYFHRVANGRKRKNTMFSLNDNDVIIKGTHNLLKHATTYYKNLFGPTVGNLIPFDPNMRKPHEKLTLEENNDIYRPFTMEEVNTALDSIATNKHLGLIIFMWNFINIVGTL
jgi:mannosylglycoprotein endo-beta-mannosidase